MSSLKTTLPLSLLLVACSGAAGAGVLDEPPSSIANPPVEKTVVATNVETDAEVTSDASVDSSLTGDADASEDASQTDSGEQDSAADVDAAPPVPRYGVTFNGTVGARLSMPAPDTLIGQSSVTLEAYVRFDGHTGPRDLIFSSPYAYCALATTGGRVGKPTCCAFDSNNAMTCVDSNVTLNTGTFYHVAFVLDGGSWTMFLDGFKQGTVMSVFSAYPSFPLPVVTEHPANHLIFGVMYTNEVSSTSVLDEFRLTYSALYTANFTPPKHLDAVGAVNLLLDEGGGKFSGPANLSANAGWISVDR